MRKIRQCTILLISIIFAVGGCTSLPDVQSFANSTASLAAAAGTHYNDVAADVAALKPVLVPGEDSTDTSFTTRKKQLEETQEIFKETGKNLDKLFAAMTTYSEKLTSLVAAGKTGPKAAQSIVDSAQGFAELAGMSGLPLAAPITKAFDLIADEFTKMQAKDSLKEAIAAAQPGVDIVAEQFAVIYGEAITQAANSIRNTKSLEASIDAGPGIIGFYDIVERNYNAYYRVLNGFVSKFNPEAPASVWRGFCLNSAAPARPSVSCRQSGWSRLGWRPFVLSLRRTEQISRAYMQPLTNGIRRVRRSSGR